MSDAPDLPANPEDDLPRMTLSEHLEELRGRLFRSVIAIVAAMVVAFLFYEEIFVAAKQPFVDVMTRHGLTPSLHALEPGEGFIQVLKIVFLVGMVSVSPYVLWQMWGFIAAGLYDNEKRQVRIFFPVSIVLFALGLMVAYFILIPFGFNFLVGIELQLENEVSISLSSYISTSLTMLFAMGFLFELPLVMMFLQGAGVVERKTFVKGWRFAVLLSVVVGMLLTDPSPVTQLMMAIPIVGLYFMGIWGGRFVGEDAERFTILKAWPIVLAAAAFLALLVYREPINEWSMDLFGAGAAEEAESGEQGEGDGGDDEAGSAPGAGEGAGSGTGNGNENEGGDGEGNGAGAGDGRGTGDEGD